MRCRRLSSSHQNPSEVDDITMTSFESQLLVLLQLHFTFPKYIIIFLRNAHESPCLMHRLGIWSHYSCLVILCTWGAKPLICTRHKLQVTRSM